MAFAGPIKHIVFDMIKVNELIPFLIVIDTRAPHNIGFQVCPWRLNIQKQNNVPLLSNDLMSVVCKRLGNVWNGYYNKSIHLNSLRSIYAYLRAQEPHLLLLCLVQFWWILDLLHLVLTSLSPHIESVHVCVWDLDDVLCANKWKITCEMI